MTEEELNIDYWNGIIKGNKKSLFDLYNHTYFHLVRFGLKMTGDDELVKDTIMALFFKLWDKHAELTPVSNVRPYLFTSLRRMLIDHHECESKTDSAIGSYYKCIEVREHSYEEVLIMGQKDEEIKKKLVNAMQQLTPRQQELLQLKFFEGLSYKEVATETSQTIKTAYNTIYNAIRSLRAILG